MSTSLEGMPTVTDARSAERWLNWALDTMGGGFHPDTPACDYVTGDGGRWLFDDDVARFDLELAAVFAHLRDPYELTNIIEAERRAGLQPTERS